MATLTVRVHVVGNEGESEAIVLEDAVLLGRNVLTMIQGDVVRSGRTYRVSEARVDGSESLIPSAGVSYMPAEKS